MSASGLIIIGEVFLVLVGIGGFLFYYLNNLNNELRSSNDKLREKLKDEKRRAKGLRVKIQDQNKTIVELEKKIENIDGRSDSSQQALTELESEYQSVQQQLEELENSNQNLQQQLSNLEKELESSHKKAQQLESELNRSDDENYEELYYDLKNSIAYNMSGGDQVLDVLRDRLRENGNLAESEKLAELKERYNSLGEMVGIVSEVELFVDIDEEEEENELEKIEEAESISSDVNDTLKAAKALEESSGKMLESKEQEVAKLTSELVEALAMNKKLSGDLEITNNQLLAFVAKARTFQAQKEQIKMHKATQNQMHRNFVNLNADYKQLTRKHKTLEARNEMLAAQLRNSSEDNETINKLEVLRSQLEDTEKVMDRLIIEKEMLEQQFLTVSEESLVHSESTKALERLTSEHQLLEQQFLEVLNELDADHTPSE
ncbi:hypothetical protein [Aliikangiella coralliicola]|uniref:Uncharacterized protein n=1 Tax=Aliikangiella coralliicola TaxID=2592383 RepID=A0A545UAX1_9GAMM|nr:hypothetical protein [Aliikangiella coralliicola]TQV86624.1 hypothetical protein FLL46_17175 [Aliikangiella coralliicola]